MPRIAGLVARLGLVVICVLQPLTSARAGPPGEIIQRLNLAFIEVMRNAATLGYDGRYQALAPVLNETYDFPEMARVSAGRHWRDLTDVQKDRVIEAFRAYSTATYAARFDGFEGERFEILGEEPAPTDGVRVNNQIVTAGGEPIRIDYLLRRKDGRWRIVDVYLKSSVSELAVRRSEFTAVLAKGGFDGLIADLKAKVTKLEKDAATTAK
jgi:phospholipid transport system substrate-binding protein